MGCWPDICLLSQPITLVLFQWMKHIFCGLYQRLFSPSPKKIRLRLFHLGWLWRENLIKYVRGGQLSVVVSLPLFLFNFKKPSNEISASNGKTKVKKSFQKKFKICLLSENTVVFFWVGTNFRFQLNLSYHLHLFLDFFYR